MWVFDYLGLSNLGEFEDVLALIGLLVFVHVALKTLSSFYKTFLRPGKKLSKLGDWAVVTGATDGIGKAYSFALGKQGLNVLLISRTESKLQAVQKELQAKYSNIEVKYAVCDYSKFNENKVQCSVRKAVLELSSIAVLINNVGVSYRYPMYFDEISDAEVQQMLTMNIDSTVWMTRMVLPGMLERKKGAVVNLSSAAARYPLPLLAEYSGSKAFVERFTTSLNAEYAASKGVTFQCQVPFFVATKLAKMRPSFTVPTPKQYVAKGIKWIGYANDVVVSPFWFHAVQGYLMFQLPEAMVTYGIRAMHLATRKRGKKKDARLAAEATDKKK